DDRTLFVGLYRCSFRGLLEQDTPLSDREGVRRAGSCDVYDVNLENSLSDLVGKVFVDWGAGFRAWVQRADKQNKPITEVRTELSEPPFPGFLEFVRPLSQIEQLPSSWVEVLRSSRGVYLLTCPKTKEQYVGSAT